MRNLKIIFGVNKEEMKSIKDAAKSSKLTLSQHIRSKLLNYIPGTLKLQPKK